MSLTSALNQVFLCV